jgi:hypothetical protein
MLLHREFSVAFLLIMQLRNMLSVQTLSVADTSFGAGDRRVNDDEALVKLH